MDAGRHEVGRAVAQIILDRVNGVTTEPQQIVLKSKLEPGDTLRR